MLGVLAILTTLNWLGLVPWLGPGPSIRTFNLWYALLYALLAWVFITASIPATDLTTFSLILNVLILVYIMLPGTRDAFGRKWVYGK